MRTATLGPWKTTAGWVVGVAALAAAVWFAVRGMEPGALRGLGVGDAAWMAAAVLGNLVLSAMLFWRVTACFVATPPVRFGEMFALISASALLNYVPVVRAGLWGRAAYLKAKHSLGIRTSLVTLMVVLALTASVLGMAAMVLLVLRSEAAWLRWSCVGVGVAAMSVVLAVMRARRRALLEKWAWLWPWLRLGDLLVASARLWIAFAALGAPVGFADAVLLASVSLVIKLAGLTPNGLGLSEWAVAALSAALTPVAAGVAAAAAVLDRAVEVAVVVPVGLVAVGWLKRRVGDAERRDAEGTRRRRPRALGRRVAD